MEPVLIARLGAMGDILHALPAVAALHQGQPETKISWLVERRWKGLLPDFVEPIEVDTRIWRKDPFARETRVALKSLRSGHEAALAIDLQGSTKSAVLAKWMRPRLLVGPADP